VDIARNGALPLCADLANSSIKDVGTHKELPRMHKVPIDPGVHRNRREERRRRADITQKQRVLHVSRMLKSRRLVC
jgi:hypothetical protein